jgi:energy-coupling factor transporter ATP-binding protein EcfA2
VKQLVRIGMINWHLLPALDIDVTGDVGVIGENRSGKSTLLDLIQVVVTGNNGRYLRLNASATDSGRKRSLRSVHAYCLGRLSPDQVMRPQARTYIYLVFQDTVQPHHMTSIGLSLEANQNEASERPPVQFIADGISLSCAHLLEPSADGAEQPRDWAVVRPYLERLCSEAGGTLLAYRNEPGKYVQDYMKTLSTGGRFINTDQFLKAFVNAISFEQIPSATDFVRRYLLEDTPIRIGQLRESIATYHFFRKQVEEARDKLARLHALRDAIAAYKDDILAQDREQWIAARAQMDHAFAENRTLRRQRDRNLADLAEARRAKTELEVLTEELKDELETVRDAIAAQTGSAQRRQLDGDRKVADAQLKETVGQLETIQKAVNQGAHALKFRTLLPTMSADAFAVVERMRQAGGPARVPAWPNDPQALAAALDDPRLHLPPLIEACERAANEETKAQGLKERELEEVVQQIKGIEETGIAIDRTVERMVAEMEGFGWRPRIVCTLLRVVDDRWRDAAEALLGRDREAILVADAHVEDAIRYLQRNRGRLRGCRVVNSRKLSPSEGRPESGTLAGVLASDDPLAMAFVVRRIGGVRLAYSIEELHRPGRAVMQDGTYDDGLTVEMREVVGGYKIGAGAGRIGLSALERRRGAIEDELKELEDRAKDLRNAAGCLTVLSAAVGRGQDLITALDRCTRLKEKLDTLAEDIRALEQNVSPAFKARMVEIEQQIRLYAKGIEEAIHAEAGAKHGVGAASEKLLGGEGAPGSTLSVRRARQKFQAVRHRIDRPASRAAYRTATAAQKGNLTRTAELARRNAEDAAQRIQSGGSAIFDGYLAFHMDFGLKSELTRERAQVVRDVEPWVEQGIERIEGVDLVRHEADAQAAAERSRNFFQHSFAYELRRRFDALHSALDDMNRTLRAHDFHYEVYRFVAHPVEPYQAIIRLVEASRADDSMFALLFDSQVDAAHPHAAALKTVQELLLDEKRDVVEFEDYRRYFSFNLIMKDIQTNREVDLETRRGTGSGAEQQVPFYIAIGTALAAAYHGKAAGDETKEKGIGLAVFDEAFSKLDGKNQKACMDYYEKLGLQVVVAAPFEKRATLYETMECFVETIRNGDLIDVEAYGVGERTRQAFAEANPANLGLDGFRRMMAAQAEA